MFSLVEDNAEQERVELCSRIYYTDRAMLDENLECEMISRRSYDDNSLPREM